MIAHVGGLPLEEAILAVVPVAGVLAAMTRAWVVDRTSGRRR